ncbi:MAG: hypothetical protein HS126_08905 [Anaerolineales bacterium]|nr:hypothetical protein [Anaerolineales bacterium]
MAEILGNASPGQILMLMAVPVIGVILFGGVLFVAFSGRRKKQQMNLGHPLKTGSLLDSLRPVGEINPAFPPPKQAAFTLNDPVVTDSQGSNSEGLFPVSDLPADLDLNLNLLHQRTKTEAEMMNVSKSSHESRSGLSARLSHQPRPAAEATPPEASRPAAIPPAASLPATHQQPVKPSITATYSSEPVELLRLLCDPQSGQLIVEIAGRRYSKLAEITDKEIGQYILKLAAHLLAFTNGMIATEAGLKTFQVPKVGETPAPPVAPTPASPLPSTSVQPTPPAPEVEAAFLATLRAQPAAEPPQPQRRGLFGRSKPAAPAEPLLPPLNLAGQINEIAQARLRYSPLAGTTKLEITSDPGGGILINVNGMIYQGPDEIPQPEVKELIKASIKEWEKG